MTVPPTPDKASSQIAAHRRKIVRVWLIILQVFVILFVFLSIALGIFGNLLDGSYMWGFILVFPLIALALIVASWMAWRRNAHVLAVIMTAVPVLVPLCVISYYSLLSSLSGG